MPPSSLVEPTAEGREAPPRSSGRLGGGAERWGLLAFALLFLAFAVISWAKWPLLTADSARELYVPFRILHGDMIYADFTYLYGPVAPALNAGLLAAFGERLEVLYLAGLANLAAVMVLLYLLARQVLPVWPAAAVLFLFFTHFALGRDIAGYVWPYAFAATYGVTLGLLTVYALVRYQRSAALGWLVAAGAAIGLSTVTKLEYGFAAAVTGALFLLGRLVLRRHLPLAWPFWLEAATLIAPAALTAGTVVAAVLARVPGAVVLESVWPVALMKLWNSAGAWHGHGQSWITNLRWVALEAVVLGGIAAHQAIGDRLRTPGPRLRGAHFVYGRWALLLAALALIPLAFLFRHGLQWHYETVHLYWMSPGFLLLFAMLAGVVGRLVRAVSTGTAVPMSAVAWGLIASYGCLVAARTLMHGYNDYTRYQAPIALIAWVALAAVWLPARFPQARSTILGMMAGLAVVLGSRHLITHTQAYTAPHVPVRAAVGTVLAEPAFGEPFNQALAYLKPRLKPGDAIVAAPMEASFYLFTGRDNVLRYDNLFYGYLTTAAEQQAVIRRMQERRVRYVLVSNYGGGQQFGVTFMQDLNAWIVKNCRLVGDFGGPRYHIKVYATAFAAETHGRSSPPRAGRYLE